MFAVIFFTAAHFHLADLQHFSFSHRRYKIFMFFFQRKSSLLYLITCCSSFSVIHVSVDIKNNFEKGRLLSKSPGGYGISRQKNLELPVVSCLSIELFYNNNNNNNNNTYIAPISILLFSSALKNENI